MPVHLNKVTESELMDAIYSYYSKFLVSVLSTRSLFGIRSSQMEKEAQLSGKEGHI